jgi:simple sugar transport system substrate-binding protein
MSTDGRRAIWRVIASRAARWVSAGALLTAVAVSLAACGGGSPTASTSAADTGSSSSTSGSSDPSSKALSGGAPIAGKKVLFLSHSTPDDTFFVPAVKGAKAAAELTGLKVEVQYGNNDDATTRRIANTAMASGVDALDLSIQDAALNSVICNAVHKGTPVVGFNSNGTTGEGKKCLPAYIGQDFVASGELIAQKLLANSGLKSGDHAFCPVEFPEQPYAAARYKGATNALKAHGISCDELGTGVDPAKAKSAEVNYLLGHPDTKAILGLGLFALQGADQATKQLNKNIPVAGFDLSKPIMDAIKNGRIIATIDQQPYAQGFVSVIELALQMKYGLKPASVNTSNGAVIDKTNVASVAALVPDYR